MEPSSKAAAAQEEFKKFNDMQHVADNSQITQQLKKDEIVIFSCILEKRNRWGFSQERTLLLTNHALYNLKDTEIKRRINVKSLKAITRSSIKDSLEFVVHVHNEYDYRYESELREQIFEAIKHTSFTVNKKNIPVYAVPDKSLGDYCTKKSNVADSKFIVPPSKYRVTDEDIFSEEAIIHEQEKVDAKK